MRDVGGVVVRCNGQDRLDADTIRELEQQPRYRNARHANAHLLRNALVVKARDGRMWEVQSTEG